MILRQKHEKNELAPALQKMIEAPVYDRTDISCVTYELGMGLDDHQRFSLNEAQVSVHMAVIGGSGSGKSKMLELLLRQRLLQGKPFGFWDPHGDGVKGLVAFAAGLKALGLNDEVWQKIHYLELTPDCVFSFDPAVRAPLRAVVGDYAYYQWLKTRVDRICKVILRKVSEADQDLMNRLKRWLKNVIYACLVAYDGQNSHVGLDKALVFTDPAHPQFEMLYERVRPHLPVEVVLDFDKLVATKRPIDREKWVESTINRLRDCLSPLVKMVYSQSAPSIDIKGIIDRGESLLIDLKENEFFSHDEKVTIGGLLLMEVLSVKEAEENLPEDERKEFMIVVDEVGELLGEDLKRALGATRKFKCPIVLGGQDLSTFARGDLDMTAKLLTMCGTVLCFNNTFKDDKELLADRVFCGSLDLFTKRVIEVQRQRGDRVLQLDEVSESFGLTENWSETDTATQSHTHATAIGEALAIAKNHSDTQAAAQGLSRRGATGDPEKMFRSNSATRTHAEGGGETVTNNSATTDTDGDSTSKAKMNGGGANRGLGVVHKTMILANVVSEWEEDGTLLHGEPELQRARQEQRIHTLGVGQAAVAVRGITGAFVVQIDEVREWWPDGRTKYEAIKRMKARLRDIHPYFFCPKPTSRVSVEDEVRPDVIVEHGKVAKAGAPAEHNAYGY